MAKSAYIHIPFCAYKCDFCDFAAFAGVDQLAAQYCSVVADEISQRLSKQPNDERLSSVFFGGGTPGYIDPEQLAVVFSALKQTVGLEKNAEISLETTPHSISADKAKRWLDMGINRLSVGVQSFIDEELLAAGRDHTSAQALAGIDKARQAGFENISLDLMYGLPTQTDESWKKSLSQALSLGLPHMSAYGLSIAANSPLLLRHPRDSSVYPDEESFVHMYETLIEMCSQFGLEQYEISNFSAAGFQSRHNLTYWCNEEYLAFGVSAHRYVNGARSSNFRALMRYMRDYLADESCEIIDEQTRAKEAIMLGLRMRKGLNLSRFQQEHGISLEELISANKPLLLQEGFLLIDDGWLRLSQKGVLVSNTVLAELI
jgi:oxygen-independent coproporphyrinogen-3 oxidase